MSDRDPYPGRLVLVDPRSATDLTKAVQHQPGSEQSYSWMLADLPPDELAMDHIRFTPKLAGPGRFRAAVEWQMDEAGNIMITSFAIVDKTAAEVVESDARFKLPR